MMLSRCRLYRFGLDLGRHFPEATESSEDPISSTQGSTGARSRPLCGTNKWHIVVGERGSIVKCLSCKCEDLNSILFLKDPLFKFDPVF